MPVAIITGIGRAAALLFARNKYQLSLTGRNEAALKEVAKECVEQGITENDVTVSPADLADDSAPNTIVNNTLSKFNRIDSLVNSAGILRAGQVLDSDISVYDELFNVNVRWWFPGVTYYCMSKSAVDQFTKCLALEMAPHGVRVNAVNNIIVVQFLEKSKTTHALGRPGEAKE
ncbi:unnamed protein product, partial [Heligmosomoides polygyrus]|uniref:Dehydrogenase/reductase SDR family member 11 n=1 Tax=Heligmosomoides polygyrus TaxID=6339 RepID=A0A183GWK6_HELPZ